jgi:hypothetical protein
LRSATRLFGLLAGFGLAVGTFYWWLTEEWAGSVLLWLLGAMGMVLALWSRTRERADVTAAADDPASDPADWGGQAVGSFPTASLWPLFLTIAVMVLGAGLVYGTILLPLGIGLAGAAVLGLMRESES